MKTQIRVLGIDDAPFSFGDRSTEFVGIVIRAPSYVEGAILGSVEVDGNDATEKIARSVLSSRFRPLLSIILIDGVALGGFNVIDIEELHRLSGVPVATVTRKQPDLEAMTKVLKRKFSDWKRRQEAITRKNVFLVHTGHRPLHVTAAGMDEDDVCEVLGKVTVRGALPEPLRIAHIVATALKKGESRGRA